MQKNNFHVGKIVMRMKSGLSVVPFSIRGAGLLLFLTAVLVPWRTGAVGAWTPLAHPAPGGVQLMLLLSDGTVMAANKGGNVWYRLTPDIHGSYINGAWTTRTSMVNTRLFYSSAVLRDGRVLVAGAEYGNGWATSEVYNPSTDTWTTYPVPAGLITLNNNPPPSGQSTAGFSDSGCKILANGNVLVAPVYPVTNNATLVFNPGANTWSGGPKALASQNEASWVKLPDDSILTVDKSSTTSERYIPSQNQWANDAVVSVSLYDGFAELGAGIFLQNGKAFFLGGNGKTALYTPSGNTSPGSWATGPNIPAGLAAPDAPAAVMVNGKVLCAFGSPIYTTNILGTNSVVFPKPTSFYEYDPIGNSFTPVTGPNGATDNISPFQAMMLTLPDGTVLYSDYGTQLYVYTPDGSPLPAGKPTITSITQNSDGTSHLVGTKLNGISEGAAFGDDAQMDSNYPLVRITDGSGNVFYGGTFFWSSTSISTGNTPVSTEFGTGLDPGTYSLVVVANGISSDPVTIFGKIWVDFSYGGSTQDGKFASPYKTLAGGVSAVPSGGTIAIKPGLSHETMTISKPMEIIAIGGATTIGQ